MKVDVLIVGGGTGGCAAAMACSALGLSVLMTEECRWIGGQFTAQAVPPDEHAYVESFGTTRRYRRYREGVRDYYRTHYPLLPRHRLDPHLNPGGGNVSRLCHEPRVGVQVLEQMMAASRSAGRLQIWTRERPVAVDAEGERVRAVTLENLDSRRRRTVEAQYVLDATELGDLLPLAGVEYVSGAESQGDTGEPHAPARADPEDVQAFTWCFAMSHAAGENRVIDQPAQYAYWRDHVPQLSPPWTGKLLSFTNCHPITLGPDTHALFATPGLDPFGLWDYRKIVDRTRCEEGAIPHDVTLVNWPQNDYWGGNVIDKSEAERTRHFEAARQLSLSLFYWLQTAAPHPDGTRAGYPGLFLRPDIMGTEDGLAMFPYIRESRRIRALFTVSELHVGAEAAPCKDAALFADSVGVGCVRIDLHPSAAGRNYVDIPSRAFHIPLGALIPVRMENLLPAAKNIGTTHIANGAYRLHPTEWNIGEAAGLLAAFCIAHRVVPRQVPRDARRLAEFQALLERQGIELRWPSIEGALSHHRWDPPDRSAVRDVAAAPALAR